MTRPPPRSTLFPYTTLFRSRPTLRPRKSWNSITRLSLMHHPALLFTQHRESRSRVRKQGSVRCQTQRRDRKSTRLNSSHVSISYAVFCLKKKKIEKHPTEPS